MTMENKVPEVHRESLGSRDREVLLVHRDQREIQAHRADLEARGQRESREILEDQGQLEKKEILGIQGFRDQKEILETKETREIQEPLRSQFMIGTSKRFQRDIRLLSGMWRQVTQ